MFFHLGKGAIIFVILLFSLFFSFFVCNAKDIDGSFEHANTYSIAPDTIVITEVDTVVVEDTIVSYYKVNVRGGVSENFMTGDFDLQNQQGYTFSLGVDYVRERFFVSTGLNYGYLSTDAYSINTKNPVINFKDSLFQFQQIVDGELITTDIPVRWSYVDTMNVLLDVKNQYRYLSFPFVVGYLYDKGRWSFLNGIGIQTQFLINSNNQNIVPFENDVFMESVYLKRFNMGVLFQQQTLYYLSNRWAMGMTFSATFFPASMYRGSSLPKTKTLNLKAAIMISYIL